MTEAETSPWKLGVGSVPLVLFVLQHSSKETQGES